LAVVWPLALPSGSGLSSRVIKRRDEPLLAPAGPKWSGWSWLFAPCRMPHPTPSFANSLRSVSVSLPSRTPARAPPVLKAVVQRLGKAAQIEAISPHWDQPRCRRCSRRPWRQAWRRSHRPIAALRSSGQEPQNALDSDTRTVSPCSRSTTTSCHAGSKYSSRSRSSESRTPYPAPEGKRTPVAPGFDLYRDWLRRHGQIMRAAGPLVELLLCAGLPRCPGTTASGPTAH
jgi:hypothetical protein